MNYQEIKKYLSAARLTRYEQACQNNQRKVLKIYQANKSRTNDFLKCSVTKILRRTNGNVSKGKIIADLNLGFWTELFELTHYKILHGTPIKIFTKLPPSVNRKTINQKLERIRNFRNRVYHNEPIIFDTDQSSRTIFSLKNAEEVYADMKDIFMWFGIDFYDWTKKINNVEFEIERAKSIYNHYPSPKYYILRIRIGYKLYMERYLRSPWVGRRN